MSKVSLDEKKLEALRRQLQVRTSLPPVSKIDSSTSVVPKISSNPTSALVESSEYLHRDLLKIFILASLAVVFQLALYFSMTNHLLNLNI